MNKQEFRDLFWNMPAMKYMEKDPTLPKAKEMIDNKGNNYLAMPKWDGEWNMAIILDDEILMRGRAVTVSGDYKNRADMLPDIVNELRILYSPGTVLLGEICFEDITKTSKDVGTIMRCLPEKAIARQKVTPLKFKVFDVLASNWESIYEHPFEYRFQAIFNAPWMLKMMMIERKHVDVVEVYTDNFYEHAMNRLKLGGEGIVIIKKDEPYRPGKRKAWSSLKLKKKLEERPLEVISFIEPNIGYEGKEIENWKYWMYDGEPTIMENHEFTEQYMEETDGFTYPVTKPYFYGWKNGVVVKHNGNLIRVTSGLTDANREWLATDEADFMLKRKELYVIIGGMEFTDDSIRHPTFVDFIDKCEV